MGEMVSASRLLITECLQSWKPELKILGNPNLSTSRPDSVLFCPQSRNLPWCFGRGLQSCCAGASGRCAGERPKDAQPLYPGQGEPTAATGDASWKSCSTYDFLSSPFVTISGSWLLHWDTFTVLLYSWLGGFRCFYLGLFFFFFPYEMKNHWNLQFSRGDVTKQILKCIIAILWVFYFNIEGNTTLSYCLTSRLFSKLKFDTGGFFVRQYFEDTDICKQLMATETVWLRVKLALPTPSDCPQNCIPIEKTSLTSGKSWEGKTQK